VSKSSRLPFADLQACPRALGCDPARSKGDRPAPRTLLSKLSRGNAGSTLWATLTPGRPTCPRPFRRSQRITPVLSADAPAIRRGDPIGQRRRRRWPDSKNSYYHRVTPCGHDKACTKDTRAGRLLRDGRQWRSCIQRNEDRWFPETACATQCGPSGWIPVSNAYAHCG